MTDSEFSAAMMAAFMCGDQPRLVQLCQTSTVTCTCGHTTNALTAVQQSSSSGQLVANCPGCGKNWVRLT